MMRIHKLCVCGCGQSVNPGCKFLRGHYTRNNSNREKLRKLWLDPKSNYNSPERSHKLRVANLGKVVTIETRLKLRQANLGKQCGEEFREKMRKSRLGSHHTLKTKKKIREKRIIYLASGKSKLRDTYIELEFESGLIKRNIPYRKQVPVLGHTVVDFILLENIVIYCDGEYWHNLPGRREMDIKQTNLLESNEYIVYRFTGKEINKSVVACIDKIGELKGMRC